MILFNIRGEILFHLVFFNNLRFACCDMLLAQVQFAVNFKTKSTEKLDTMRTELILLLSFAASAINCAAFMGLRMIDQNLITFRSLYGYLFLFIALLATSIACLMVYRRTAQNRKTQAAITLVLTAFFTAAFVISSR